MMKIAVLAVLAIHVAAPDQRRAILHKVSPAVANLAKDGRWDARDKTGDARIDSRLTKLVVSQPCDYGKSAVEEVAYAIKIDPQKYINPDGSLNEVALEKLIAEKQAEWKKKHPNC